MSVGARVRTDATRRDGGGDLRSRTRRVLFPGPTTADDAAGRPWVVAAIVALAAGLSLARQWPVVLDNIYAEDGRIFLTEAYGRTLWAAVVKPLSGYLHVVPRAGAEAAELAGPAAAPWIFALGGALVAGVSAATVWVASAAHLRSATARAAVAALVGLSPVAGGESINNLAYAQWLLTAAAVWLVLWRPASRRGAAAGAAVAVAAGLSSAMPLLLAPAVALRLWATRRVEDRILMAPFALAVAAQAVTAVLDPQPSAGTPLDVAVAGWVQRVVVGGIVGERGAMALWDAGGWAAIMAVAVAAGALLVAALSRADARARVVSVAAVGVGALAYAVSAWSRGFFWGIAWRAGEPAAPLASRYMIVPGMLVVAALLVALEARTGRWRRVGVLVLATTVGVAVLTSFRVPAPRADVSWSASLEGAPARCADGRDEVEIAVSPQGWAAVVPCRAVTTAD